MMKRTRKVVLLVLFAAILSTAASTARAVDIPTWQIGDWWDFERSLSLDFTTTDPLELVFSIVFNDNYRLTVVDIIDRITTGADPVRAYHRTRSNSTLSGTGTASIAGIPLNIRWDGGTTSGEDWTALGDLSNLQERFELTGNLDAQVLLWLEVASISFDLTFEFRPPREIADFPIETVGEEWSTTITQAVRGHFRVQWNEDFPLWPGGSPPDDIDEEVSAELSQGITFHYLGREARGGFPETYRADAGSVMSFWYEPSIKEFVEVALGRQDFGDGFGLSGLVTEILGSSLLADPNLSITDIAPSPVRWGRYVQLLGITDPAAIVTGTFLGEGLNHQTVADNTGLFELWLRAPDHDDHTPSTDDAGSFGVEVVAESVGRKVVTVQLGLPPTDVRRSWLLYE